MSSEQTVIRSDELEYKEKMKLSPTYQMQQIIQRQGGSSVPVGGNVLLSGQYSLFEIPAVAFNLSKSVLTLNFTAPHGVGQNGTNVYLGILAAISRIQFYAKNKNEMLLDLNNFVHYTKIIFNSDIKLQEFLTFDCNSTGSAIAGVSPVQRTNAVGAATTINVMRRDFTGYAVAYTESRELISNAAASTSVSLQINLGLIKNTILAIDKDLFFDDTTYLKIYWSNYSNFGYSDPAGAGDANPANIVQLATFGLTNVYLYLAVEVNDYITENLRQQVNSPNGMSMLMDYPNTFNFPLQSNLQSFSIFADSAMGIKLKRIYWAPFFQAPASLNLTYDTSNITAGTNVKITQVVTKLNNKNIVQNPIDCTINQDYIIMKDKMKNSLIQNLNIYKYQWFWAESFDGQDLCEHDQNLDVGLPLTREVKYDVTLNTTNTALSHYAYVITLRNLIIRRNNVTLI